jgi:hypothetical protein
MNIFGSVNAVVRKWCLARSLARDSFSVYTVGLTSLPVAPVPVTMPQRRRGRCVADNQPVDIAGCWKLTALPPSQTRRLPVRGCRVVPVLSKDVHEACRLGELPLQVRKIGA